MTRGIHESDRQQPIVLTVPGLNGSGPSHWQTLWEQSRPDTSRIELGMWSQPRRNAWVTKIDQAIRGAQPPIVLAAHSLGCLAVAGCTDAPIRTTGELDRKGFERSDIPAVR